MKLVNVKGMQIAQLFLFITLTVLKNMPKINKKQ